MELDGAQLNGHRFFCVLASLRVFKDFSLTWTCAFDDKSLRFPPHTIVVFCGVPKSFLRSLAASAAVDESMIVEMYSELTAEILHVIIYLSESRVCCTIARVRRVAKKIIIRKSVEQTANDDVDVDDDIE